MNDNKLIAEFMGFTKDSKELYLIDDYTLRSEDEYQATYVDEMKFHTSWDWLMPVVLRLLDLEYNEFDGADDLSFRLNDTLLEVNLDSLYSIVLEFINEYNKTI